MLGENLLRYKTDQKFCILDFETEGLNLVASRPWQLSFAIFDAKNIYEEHDYLIKWDNLQMSVGAAAITGFNPINYKNTARNPQEILDIFDKYLNDKQYRLVFHNGLGFDTMIYNVWRRNLNLPTTYEFLYDREFACYDTLSLSKAYKLGVTPDISSSNNFLAWQYKMLSKRLERTQKTNLAAMGREFKLNFDEKNLHNAKFDIRLNIEVFRQLIWKLEI